MKNWLMLLIDMCWSGVATLFSQAIGLAATFGETCKNDNDLVIC